jgi:tRNA-modifying protein YgfZ
MTSWLSFLASRGAHSGAAGVAHFGDARAELAAARDGTIVADISHNALVAVSGDDARAFLHGQFTNDVEALEPGAAQWNGWCSAKGRLLATFLLVRHGDEYLVLLPAEIAPAFTRRLAMFVLRSRVKIADAGERFVRIGFAGRDAAAAVARHWGRTPDPMRAMESDLGLVIALDPRRFVVLAMPGRAPHVWELLAQGATPAGPEAWDWMGVQAGIPIIVTATQDAFVPQMANFDLVGGVSFRKGCYPGQEIVARTQYRGILKRRMAVAHVDSPAAPAPGDSLYSASFGEQTAGTVVQAAHSPDGGYDLLAVAQIESLNARDLALGAPGGPPIEVRDFPALAAAS